MSVSMRRYERLMVEWDSLFYSLGMWIFLPFLGVVAGLSHFFGFQEGVETCTGLVLPVVVLGFFSLFLQILGEPQRLEETARCQRCGEVFERPTNPTRPKQFCKFCRKKSKEGWSA